MSWEEMKEGKSVREEEKIQTDFIPLNQLKKKRGLKIGIFGDYSTGKTHFALTAPEPIFVIDTEFGVSPLADKFKDKDIRIIEALGETPKNLEHDDVLTYLKTKETIEKLKDLEEGTIVIDSITDIWKACQTFAKVRTFKIKPEDRLKYQFDWGVINALYQQLILKLLRIKSNLILTARTTEIYTGPTPTGILGPSWQKKTGFFVDVVISNTLQVGKDLKFLSEIQKCRFTKKLIGKQFENLTFQKLKESLKTGGEEDGND